MLIFQTIWKGHELEFVYSNKTYSENGYYIGSSVDDSNIWIMDNHGFTNFKLELIYD